MVATICTFAPLQTVRRLMEKCPHTIHKLHVVVSDKSKDCILAWAKENNVDVVERTYTKEYGGKAPYYLYNSIITQVDLIVFIGRPSGSVQRHVVKESLRQSKKVWIK